MAAASVCAVPGCPNPAQARRSRCASHQRAYDAQRGTAAQRGYGINWPKRSRAFLAENPYCVVCGQAATVVDHIVPLRFGGADEPDNYQAMCKHHHDAKTMREVRYGRSLGGG